MKKQLLCILLVLGCIEVVGKLDIDAVDVSDVFFQLPHALSCVQGRTCVPLNPIDVNVVVLSHFHSEEVGLYGNAAVGSDLGSTEASATISLVASSSALSVTSPSLVAVSAITTISRSLVVITSSSILLAASTAALVIVPIHLISGLNLIFLKRYK